MVGKIILLHHRYCVSEQGLRRHENIGKMAPQKDS